MHGDGNRKKPNSQQFSRLIAGFPSLEVLELTGTFSWKAGVFQRLGTLRRLRSLAIYYPSTSDNTKVPTDQSISESTFEELVEFARALNFTQSYQHHFLLDDTLVRIAKSISNSPQFYKLRIVDLHFRNDGIYAQPQAFPNPNAQNWYPLCYRISSTPEQWCHSTIWNIRHC
ncbi:hypothetical protein BJV82DRAFT_346210 [Fennellomyces sp. T-0311]|nr:hypothetical protein BJV82DRAFT_346210 [Fennellomyces sp. T-0311]